MTKYFKTLEVNAGMRSVSISLDWESPAGSFISGSDRLLSVHERVDHME
jgi:hypothetical protein